MDTTKAMTNFYSLGLVGSGIGVWWIKYENGMYIHYQTESSCNLFNQELKNNPPKEIYGEGWEASLVDVVEINSSYKGIINNGVSKIKDIIAGVSTFCEYNMPWVNEIGEEMWLTDKAYLVDSNEDGTAKTIVGVTINESLRGSRRDRYHKIEEVNIKLRSAEKRIIDFADFLVWSMNYKEFPDGDYLFSNDEYSSVLGLDKNQDGYIKFSDIILTAADDAEGKQTMTNLIEKFSMALNNKSDKFIGVLVKHRNLKTKEVMYLKHYTRVDERDANGKIIRISGYLVDVTTEIKTQRENEELDLKNKELQLAQKLAVNSGNVLIWFLNTETSPKQDYFFGNEILFQKLGIKKYLNDYFLIQDFNNTIYTEDAEGQKLYNEYIELDNLIDSNDIQSYSKKLVKHKNPLTGDILYLEHSFAVEERYPDTSLKIRGGFMNDITQETLYRKRIEFLVKHDSVTGLYNRNKFEEFVSSSYIPSNYTLLVIDIDGLKFINDAFGHYTGDEVIKILANILTTIFRNDSKIYRIGGDEFTVITSDIDPISIDERIKYIKQLIKEGVKDTTLSFSISVGYEIVIENSLDFNTAFISAENIMYRRKLSIRSSRKSQTMDTVLTTLNTKTEETKEHCDRLGYYAVKILQEIGYTRTSDLEDIKLLCRVHDIGKITVSEELLSKPGKLTDKEYAKIKTHSEAGFKIIKNIVESDVIANGVLYHHERFDGTGYPFGLKGDEIPLYAKIVAVCDSFDVMVVGRPYQQKKTHNEAIDELIRCSGTQFDPNIVDVFVTLFK